MATKKFGKKNVKKTYVAIVLDRSGSMSKIHEETIEGINSQFKSLQENAKKGGNTEVTLIQFDDEIETVFDGINAQKLTSWKHNDFQPRGYTAMYDGIWRAISHLKTKEETEDTGFLVCVISDGKENSSKEVTQLDLSDEIKRLQDTGKWTFTYMLANQDIHQVSSKLNVPINNVASYTANNIGATLAYAVNASSTSDYFSARDKGLRSVNAFYSTEQKDLLDKTK